MKKSALLSLLVALFPSPGLLDSYSPILMHKVIKCYK